MKRKLTVFTMFLIIFLVFESLVQAATTGKLEGSVTEKSTGEPLIGASVILSGTTIGAATDIDGHYFILNVPAGSYTVEVSMIGYQKVIIQEVEVFVDLTTSIDAALSLASIELDGEVIVTAEKKLVQKDRTSSLSTTSGKEIENLPVTEISQVLVLSAGVVESEGRLHIRGGRPGEVAYWVDGVAATDFYNGTVGVTVENNSVNELQVVSGTFNAEYGQAMSGIVNIVTKDGGKEYSGQVRAFVGDYVSSSSQYNLYEDIQTDANSQGYEEVTSSTVSKPINGFNPTYSVEGSLDGPIPFLGTSLTFFTNVRYQSNEGYLYGRDWNRPIGTEGNNELVPLNPYERITGQFKLTWQVSTAIRASYNIFYNKSKRERNYFAVLSTDDPVGHDYKYNPNGLPTSLTEGLNQTITFNHVLSPSTFYEVRVSNFFSENKQYVYENPEQGIEYLVHVLATDGNADKGYQEDTHGLDMIDELDDAGVEWEYVADPNGPDGYIDMDNLQQVSQSFLDAGSDLTHNKRSTSYWIGKFDLVSQVYREHQIKVGAEGRFYNMKLQNYTLVPKTTASGTRITPYLPAIPEIGNVNRNDYERTPYEISAYLQDKMEFESIIVNLGLRFDYFNANSFIPADPTDPNIYAPLRNENIYRGWVPQPANDPRTEGQYIEDLLSVGTISEYTPDERRVFMHEDVDAKIAVSPRLGISFPITDRGVIYFSYGHFFQVPEFQYLYANPDYKVTSGSGVQLFGNANLNPQRTVMYEIGLQQQLSDDFGVDLTFFYRDVRDWVGTSPIINAVDGQTRYSIYENKDYSNVTGITIKFEKRFSQNYSFRADYSFQVAEGTYSDPDDAFNAEQDNESPALSLLPMNWDQRHTLNAQFVYAISDWVFSMIGRYYSGQPYTPIYTSAQASQGGSSFSGLATNSARRPAQTGVDLTINKMFRFGTSMNLQLFVNVFNLLDNIDERTVYTDTGSAGYTTTYDPAKTGYNENRVSSASDYMSQPGWYTEPRQIQFGVIFGF